MCRGCIALTIIIVCIYSYFCVEKVVILELALEVAGRPDVVLDLSNTSTSCYKLVCVLPENNIA